jgi:hypothetical protein
MKTGTIEPHEWWASLSAGERRLICSVMQMLRGAKRSQLRDVARAAMKWERGIGCFIKVRLIGENQRAESTRWKWKRPSVASGWVRVERQKPVEPEAPATGSQDANPTSCPSGGHSQPGAAPGRG